MINTRKALKIGALYFILENQKISQKQLLESKYDAIRRSLFTKTNKTQDDIQPEIQLVKQNEKEN